MVDQAPAPVTFMMANSYFWPTVRGLQGEFIGTEIVTAPNLRREVVRALINGLSTGTRLGASPRPESAGVGLSSACEDPACGASAGSGRACANKRPPKSAHPTKAAHGRNVK